MSQEEQPTMRCYATGKGFFVRLPITNDELDVEEKDNEAEACE
ncbi:MULTISPECIES: hypothetical protein [Aliagarivorans]|nr:MULTISPECIES: hypothetical protein [Aliagarivorans]